MLIVSSRESRGLLQMVSGWPDTARLSLGISFSLTGAVTVPRIMSGLLRNARMESYTRLKETAAMRVSRGAILLEVLRSMDMAYRHTRHKEKFKMTQS